MAKKATLKLNVVASRGKINDKGNLVGGSATITVNGKGLITFHDISVINGSKGKFVSLPRRKYTVNGEDKWANTVWIDSANLKQNIEQAMLAHCENFDAGKNNVEAGDTIPDDVKIAVSRGSRIDNRMIGISVTVSIGEDKFTVNDFSVVNGNKGTFVAPPQRPTEDKKKFVNVVWVDNAALRQAIDSAVLEYFDEQ